VDWGSVDSDKIICWCMQVTKGTIVEAIKSGARTLEEIESQTYAGSECRRCHQHIKELIEYYADK